MLYSDDAKPALVLLIFEIHAEKLVLASRTKLNTEGTRIRVNNVETRRPPTTTLPRPR